MGFEISPSFWNRVSEEGIENTYRILSIGSQYHCNLDDQLCFCYKLKTLKIKTILVLGIIKNIGIIHLFFFFRLFFSSIFFKSSCPFSNPSHSLWDNCPIISHPIKKQNSKTIKKKCEGPGCKKTQFMTKSSSIHISELFEEQNLQFLFETKSLSSFSVR